MFGICIEAGIKCPSCEGFVPVNAMVSTVRCPGCGDDLKMTLDNWESMLEEAIKSAPSYEENEGSNLSIFGSYNYKVTYGRQIPRYDDTKESIDIDSIAAHIDEGVIYHPQSKAPTNIRRLPEEYSEAFKGVIALLGEDVSQLQGTSGTRSTKKKKSKPIAFQCPNCGSGLMFDKDTDRTADCNFCNSQVYLPDDLWIILHPVSKKKRWYLLFDEMQRPLEWEREIWDALQDEEGNFYILIEPNFSQPPILVSTTSDRKMRWKRTDLEINSSTSRGYPKLALSKDGHLLVATADRSKLFILTREDGNTASTLDEPDDTGDSPQLHFSMNDCYDYGVLPDNTLFLYRNCDRQDGTAHYMEFQRFDMDGNLLELWDPDKKETQPFLQKLKKFFTGKKGPNYFDNMEDYPTKTLEFDIRLTIGADGSIYMLDFVTLIKLKANGYVQYVAKLPCHYTTGRPAVNEKGEAFLVGNRENDRVEILKVSPFGTEISVAVQSHEDGGPLKRNGALTISPDGSFSLLGYSGYWVDVPESGILPETDQA